MIRSLTHLTAALRLGVAAAVLTAARQAPAQQVLASNDAVQPPGSVASGALSSTSSGRATTGALNVKLWSGNVRGEVTGHATALLERVGPPENALDPVYPVLMRWTVESPGDGHSFAAELFGRIEGSNECMHLGGIITEGWRKGAEVQVDCLSARRGGKVVLRILPLRAAR